MSRENVEVVRGIYAALTKGDIEAALQASDPSAVHDWSRSVGPYSGIYRGRDEALGFWRAFREAAEELSFDVEESIDDGPYVLAMVRVSMRGRGSGAEGTARGPHLWTLHEGKVIRFTLYRDKTEALEAMGLSE
jgi:ketosteroid isomerase-like protein